MVKLVCVLKMRHWLVIRGILPCYFQPKHLGFPVCPEEWEGTLYSFQLRLEAVCYGVSSSGELDYDSRPLLLGLHRFSRDSTYKDCKIQDKKYICTGVSYSFNNVKGINKREISTKPPYA